MSRPPVPPRISRWLLERLLPPDEREFVLGDLDETFATAARTRGTARARRAYRRGALSAIRALAGSRRGTAATSGHPERRGDGTMMNLLQDLRFGFRMLARRPGFTAVAVLTLALAIGANTAIFTIAHTLLVEQLPYPDAERLATVVENNLSRGWAGFAVAPANFFDWRDTSTSFDRLAAWGTRALNYRGSDAPQRLRALSGTEGFLEMLGGTPALGRGFHPGEFSPGRELVVILTHGFWQRAFGGRDDVVGRAVTLNGLSYEIVGVMHPRFTFGRDIDLFVPRAFTESDRAARGAHFLNVLGRLKPDVSAAEAQTEMSALAERLGREYPTTNAGWGVVVTPLHEAVVGGVRPMLLVLLSGVAVVLLIACANVANMLLARATVRAREMAIRRAIGAGTGRIVRQLLTESVLLALAGGVLGLLLAHWGLRSLLTAYPDLLPRSSAIGIDMTVLIFTTILAMSAAVLFGLAPAFAAARAGLSDLLRESAGGGAGGLFRRGLRNGLVVVEVALALVLLVGAGLLLKSYARLVSVEPGFDTERRLSVTTLLPRPKYEAPERMIGFYEEAVGRLAALPGVEAVALTSVAPISGNDEIYSIEFEGRPPLPPGQGVSALYYLVSPNYFDAMGIPLLRGRTFTDQDRDGAPRVAIVDDEFARLHFPGEDPVGRRIRIGRNSSIVRDIVGVVGSVKHYGLDDRPQAQMYEPFAQMPMTGMNFVLKTAVDPSGLINGVRRQIQATDPDQPVSFVYTLEQLVARSVVQRRVQMTLLALFAGVALLLAAVGLYGVMSYVVSQRTQEIGIRMALGARAGSVLALVLRQALALTAAGLIVGAGVALVSARALSSTLEPMLFQVDPTDATVMLAVAAGLAAVSVLAAVVPARRAVRVDPIRALRAE